MASWRNSAGPSPGRSPSSGTGRGASPSTVRPMKRRPKRSVTPVARNTRARPDTTWFARRVTLETACTRARSPPAAAAARSPAATLPEPTDTAKPVSAPTSISPSRPRFRTPARSVTISPRAGRRSAVPARTAAATMEVRSSASTVGSPPGRWGLGPRRRPPRDPVPGEEVAGEEGEQEQALEHEHDRDGELPHDLEPLTAGEDSAQQDGGQRDARGVEPPQPGDDDRRVPVAGREARDQPVLESGHLHQAGQPGQPAAQRHRGERDAG